MKSDALFNSPLIIFHFHLLLQVFLRSINRIYIHIRIGFDHEFAHAEVRFVVWIPVVGISELRPRVLIVEITLVVPADPAFVDPVDVSRIGIWRKAGCTCLVGDLIVGTWTEQVCWFYPEFNEIIVR